MNPCGSEDSVYLQKKGIFYWCSSQCSWECLAIHILTTILDELKKKFLQTEAMFFRISLFKKYRHF